MKRSLLGSTLALAFVALVLLQASCQRIDPRRDSEKAAEEVDALMAPWSKGDTPGAAILVIKDGRVVLKKGYGLASVENKEPIGPDTAFLLGSLTKQFTAMAIMRLAER